MIGKTSDGIYYSRDLTLNYMDCDQNRKMHLSVLVGHMADAWVYSEEARGYTYEYFNARGQTNVFTRVALNIHRMPEFTEDITITCWYAGCTRDRGYKNVLITNSRGEKLVSARLESALFDSINRVALTMDHLDIERTPVGTLALDCPDCKRVTPEGELPVAAQRLMYFTDVDCNNHVSNTVYPRLVIDCLSERLRGLDYREVYLNFIRESLEGETLTVRAGDAGNSHITQCFDENGKLHFCCELIY